ncbi:MAG: disulfide bond formation protein B [Burkholderiaceae bacterium]
MTRSRTWLGLVALASLAAVAGALVAQHRFGMQPCPWCIFQRVLYLGIAAVALVGWLVPARAVTMLGALVVGVVAAGGIASAVFQHQVAAKDASCAFTLADRFLSATGLETMVPWLFQVTATCADAAAATLLGLPFEIWSGALFALVLLVSLAALRLAASRR